jgi:hypothetical protein
MFHQNCATEWSKFHIDKADRLNLDTMFTDLDIVNLLLKEIAMATGPEVLKYYETNTKDAMNFIMTNVNMD